MWPTPPYFEWARGSASKSARSGKLEDCLLVFNDGTKSVGRLISFQPDEARLAFKTSDSGAPITVSFSSLLRMRLLKPAELKYQGLPDSVADQEVSPASERQPFYITFENGEEWQGVTMGSVRALCGRFLFVPEQDAGVARWFVPARALRDVRIGAPIGQMLVSQKIVTAEAMDGALRRQRELREQKFGEFLTEN